MYKKEVYEEILQLYLMGASVWEIADYFNMDDKDINAIIDQYSPYL